MAWTDQKAAEGDSRKDKEEPPSPPGQAGAAEGLLNCRRWRRRAS